MSAFDDVRLVPCEACDGEGRDIRTGWVYEPGCGHAHKGEVDRGPCPECNGAGAVEIQVEQIEMTDLDTPPSE